MALHGKGAKGPKVAVIGGGIFGCTVALSLAEIGCNITLFEKKAEILSGASKNNQNRLHLGYHYPRDLQTALQCRAGFDHFLETFPAAISKGFPNRYFIAAAGSRTSPEDFLKFCRTANLPHEELPTQACPEVRNTSLAIDCPEVVYDCEVLKSLLLKRILSTSEIRLICGAEVADASKTARGYQLLFGDDGDTFEAVINCSYDEINRLTERLGHEIAERQYEYTVVPVIELDIPRQGITILDGPFMTLLPHGHSGRFLLYHVLHTVIATEIGPTRDPLWSHPEAGPFSQVNKKEYFEATLKSAREFVPALGRARLIGFLEGPRMVLAHRDQDDARPSIVQDYGNGYLTVFSGKIDHCIEVSGEIRKRVQQQFYDAS